MECGLYGDDGLGTDSCFGHSLMVCKDEPRR